MIKEEIDSFGDLEIAFNLTKDGLKTLQKRMEGMQYVLFLLRLSLPPFLIFEV